MSGDQCPYHRAASAAHDDRGIRRLIVTSEVTIKHQQR